MTNYKELFENQLNKVVNASVIDLAEIRILHDRLFAYIIDMRQKSGK